MLYLLNNVVLFSARHVCKAQMDQLPLLYSYVLVSSRIVRNTRRINNLPCSEHVAIESNKQNLLNENYPNINKKIT